MVTTVATTRRTVELKVPPTRLTSLHFCSRRAQLDAVRSRDPRADGQFVYSVSTTGIYCKPSCRSRPARSEHIEFHESATDAERAGFRACKRCKPNSGQNAPDATTQVIARVCRFIEQSDEAPSLSRLASVSGLSPSHLHRVFRAALGVTPKHYVDAQRKSRLKTELHASGSVTQAIYSSGFNSSGRFYEQADRLLGMSPTTFKRGGAGVTLRFAVAPCSLGLALVAASPRGVCIISLGDDADALISDMQREFPNAEFLASDPEFDGLVAKVLALVEHPEAKPELPLDIRGTAFQCRVWEALRHIPLGQTVSYAQLAHRIDEPRAVRAVARACATNRLAVAIPCHRVVRSDGGVSGYRWGVARKRALLATEASASSTRGVTAPPTDDARAER